LQKAILHTAYSSRHSTNCVKAGSRELKANQRRSLTREGHLLGLILS